MQNLFSHVFDLINPKTMPVISPASLAHLSCVRANEEGYTPAILFLTRSDMINPHQNKRIAFIKTRSALKHNKTYPETSK